MTPDQLVLHALRTMGYGTPASIEARISLPEAEATEHLLDAEAFGWVTRARFTETETWSMTDAGKRKGEQFLAAELDALDARGAVEHVLRDFLPINEQVNKACTAWQLAEMGIATEAVSLRDVLDELHSAAEELGGLESRLTAHLDRFAGYHARFASAAARAETDPAWINAIDRESCHRVWFELHEDLIATLGLTR